jgi:hypothetical protein
MKTNISVEGWRNREDAETECVNLRVIGYACRVVLCGSWYRIETR